MYGIAIAALGMLSPLLLLAKDLLLDLLALFL